MDKDYLEDKRNFVKRTFGVSCDISFAFDQIYIFALGMDNSSSYLFFLGKFEKKARIEIGKEVEGETRKEEKNFSSVTRNC